MDEGAAIVDGLERKRDLLGGERGITGGEAGDLLGEPAERRLPLATLERGECQTQQHVASSVERLLRQRIARRTGGIAEVSRRLVQAHEVGADRETPARVVGEPLLEKCRVPAHERKERAIGTVGRDERRQQEAAHGAPALVLERVGDLDPQNGAGAAGGGAGRRGSDHPEMGCVDALIMRQRTRNRSWTQDDDAVRSNARARS